ncbi:DUF4160 domain-containing protein [Anaerolineales bacterium HSG25]|nr:DUF4160 domain-containing protein [Anaerolineales bacterium HSG25]
MPVLARFHGILVRMYFREHGRPHFHVMYNEYNAVFDIETLEVMEGNLPNRARRMVEEWAGNYQTDLMEMWHSQEFRKLPRLK